MGKIRVQLQYLKIVRRAGIARGKRRVGIFKIRQKDAHLLASLVALVMLVRQFRKFKRAEE